MAFNFRRLLPPDQLATIDPSTMGQDFGPTPMAAPQSVSFQPGLGETPEEPYAPSWWDKARYAMTHPNAEGGASMQDAEAALMGQHTARLFAAEQGERLRAAGEGMDPQQLAALFQDPDGYAKAINKNYEPRAVEGGSTWLDGGKVMGTAPKFGVTPQGVGYAQDAGSTQQTGQLATPMTAEQSAKAADDANRTALERLLLPSKIEHNKAAMVNARRPRVGAGGRGGGGGFGGGFGSFGAGPAQ